MNITLLILGLGWAIGFPFFLGFEHFLSLLTGRGGLASIILRAAVWPVLNPWRLMRAVRDHRAAHPRPAPSRASAEDSTIGQDTP
ncbi:hypothetical protein [Nocardia suismassiliense]|uniref:hypothetical protein n=1 Tax=Nocardia suismassiliense TaxID=2077092 RepID=UPI00131ED2EB|nr:hypothetical protein [Nocardia suismassiliense]